MIMFVPDKQDIERYRSTLYGFFVNEFGKGTEIRSR